MQMHFKGYIKSTTSPTRTYMLYLGEPHTRVPCHNISVNKVSVSESGEYRIKCRVNFRS